MKVLVLFLGLSCLGQQIFVNSRIKGNEKMGIDFYGYGILPHLAYAEHWQTILIITNKSKTRESLVSIDFYNPNGTPATIEFFDGSETYQASNNLGVRLPPLVTVRLETTDTSPTVKTAWAKYWSVEGEADVLVLFRHRVPGRPFFEGVTFPIIGGSDFFDAVPYEELIPFDNRNDFGTAIVLCNASSRMTAIFTINAINRNGEVFFTTTETVSPMNQVAYQSEVKWPQLKGFSGTYQIISSHTEFATLGLLFTPTFSFTSQPPLTVKK